MKLIEITPAEFRCNFSVSCPAVFRSEDGTKYVVVGNVSLENDHLAGTGEEAVEIPASILEKALGCQASVTTSGEASSREGALQSGSELEARCSHPDLARYKRDDGSERCDDCGMELFGPYQAEPEKDGPIAMSHHQIIDELKREIATLRDALEAIGPFLPGIWAYDERAQPALQKIAAALKLTAPCPGASRSMKEMLEEIETLREFIRMSIAFAGVPSNFVRAKLTFKQAEQILNPHLVSPIEEGTTVPDDAVLQDPRLPDTLESPGTARTAPEAKDVSS